MAPQQYRGKWILRFAIAHHSLRSRALRNDENDFDTPLHFRHAFPFPRRDPLPGFCKILSLREKRAQGMPGARRARSLVCKNKKHTSKSPRSHRNARHSPRNGFNGFLRALPGDRAFLPPSYSGVASTNLMPASGHQDHTTSPSAAVSTKATRRAWYQSRRSFSEGGSAPLVWLRRRVHRIPPRVRDDREPPLCGTGRGKLVKVICPTAKAKFFRERD